MSYKKVIGVEVHVELATKSKMFCSCSTAFGKKENTLCCPICLGHPGTLPSVNKEAVRLAVRAGVALGCEINRVSYFDRKNYFYPDLPKGYQITQFFTPIAVGNKIIREIHIEEDAGKLIHFENETHVDFNRAGVPLIEIVTNPCFESGEEVAEFIQTLRGILTYCDISDCKMQEGSLRVDVNLSVHKEGRPLGTRTEIKNLNSLVAIKTAIEKEAQRQISILEKGGQVEQISVRFDEEIIPMRQKENPEHYRYFREPDLPPLVIDEGEIEKEINSLPEFPKQRAKRFKEQYSFSADDCRRLCEEKQIAELFEKAAALCNEPSEVKNILLSGVSEISAESLAQIIIYQKEGKINRTVAKALLGETPADIDRYLNENSLWLITDEGEILKAVEQVILNNPTAVEQYLGGSQKVFYFFSGQVMKALGGKADPEKVNRIIENKLKGEI